MSKLTERIYDALCHKPSGELTAEQLSRTLRAELPEVYEAIRELSLSDKIITRIGFSQHYHSIPANPFGNMTPWGRADYVRQLSSGVWRVSTPSHGGYYVSAEWLEDMPESLRSWNWGGLRHWFEEDCDWAKVAIAFPHLFDAESVKSAEMIVARYASR